MSPTRAGRSRRGPGAGRRRRHPRPPRAGARLPAHHRIPPARFRLRRRHRRVPVLGRATSPARASTASTTGPSSTTTRPGYLYVLWLVGERRPALVGGVGDLIKIPPILARPRPRLPRLVDDARARRQPRAARLGALIVIVNPITWFDSAVWGQVDSVGVVVLLLALRELWRDRPERSAILTRRRRDHQAAARDPDPDRGAVVVIRRALWPDGGYGDEDPPAAPPDDDGLGARAPGAGSGSSRPALAGLVTAIVLSLPFGLSPAGPRRSRSSRPPAGYPYLSVNAYNPWALVTVQAGNGIAANRQWVCDSIGQPRTRRCPDRRLSLELAGAIAVPTGHDRRAPAVLVGLACSSWSRCVVWSRARPDRLDDPRRRSPSSRSRSSSCRRASTSATCIPLVALGAILAAVSPRWRDRLRRCPALATFANMYVVLTTLYPNNPGIADWLGIGKALGSYEVVAIAAVIQAVVLVLAFSELRRRRRSRRLAGRDRGRTATGPPLGWRGAPTPGATGAGRRRVEVGRRRYAAAGSAATPPRPGRRRRRADRPRRRSARPRHRGPAPMRRAGQRDPCDPSGTPGRRRASSGSSAGSAHRLNERPIRPDRSAALHGERAGASTGSTSGSSSSWRSVLLTVRMWRLDEPYQMHFDEVYHPRTATEFLQDWRYGISHVHLRVDPPAPGQVRDGRRARGLGATTRSPRRATSASPVKDAAIEPRWDDVDDGLDGRRAIGCGSRPGRGPGLRPRDARPRRGRSRARRAGRWRIDQVGHRVFVGTSDRRDPGRRHAPARRGARSGSPAGRRRRASVHDDRAADPNSSTSRPTAARSWPSSRRPAAPTGSSGDVAIVIDAAAATEVGRVDARNASPRSPTRARAIGRRSRRRRGGLPRHDDRRRSPRRSGLGGSGDGRRRSRPSSTRTRSTSRSTPPDGPAVATIIGTPATAARRPSRPTSRCPATPEGWVGYDLATQMVHVVGTRPGTADADGLRHRAPRQRGLRRRGAAVRARPRSSSTRTSAIRPRTASSSSPSTRPARRASVDIGHHAFAWRLPGVLAGVAMGVLLYLLARLLFRRREVAVFLAILIAADGMLFAQSRIGMNDSYVGLGIVAAYTLFAALWLMRRAARAATGSRSGSACPIVGCVPRLRPRLEVGRRLRDRRASAILVLARSALGRLLLIVGLIVRDDRASATSRSRSRPARAAATTSSWSS